MKKLLLSALLLSAPLAAQDIPQATQLPGNPFVIKNTWVIGGIGLWDYLAMDPVAQRLYIAHGAAVQVVDVKSGTLAGQITGLREAHAIALDDTGQYGYISDSPAQAIRVFNRATLGVEATISIGCSPRSIAFERQSKLLFAICGANIPPPLNTVRIPINRQPAPQQINKNGISHIIAVDTDKRAAVADILVPGDLRFAQADGNNRVYITVGATDNTIVINGQTYRKTWPPRIARIDASILANDATRQDTQLQTDAARLDWFRSGGESRFVHLFPLTPTCQDPQGLAADYKHIRIFVACQNQRLVILNADGGDVIASLVTGPGTDVLGFDQDRGFIFAANGAGYGSLTIVSQDSATESYAVIQNLPTKELARTLAVNSSNGDVYLVTDLKGVDLTKSGGIGTLTSNSVNGSFQVLVISH
jgi:DNA-binding beta-propeller fold protein YncE